MNLELKFNGLYLSVLEEVKGQIPLTTPVTLKLSKATSYYGRCKRYKDKSYGIFLSCYLQNCTEQQIKNVIAHELVHTCKDCMNHGRLFKLYGAKLERLGYNILDKTLYECFEELKSQAFKYKVTCTNCGESYLYVKRINITDYKCCKCHGNLKIEELKKNEKSNFNRYR